MSGNEFTEEQLNEVAEELFEEAEKALTAALTATPEPVTDLSPEAKSEIESEAAKSLAKAAQDPIVPKQMTRQVWKQLMRIHFTVRRGKAQPCEHKLSSINVPNEKGENSIFITSDPRKNCDSCWFTYFNTNGQMTQIADECFREAGRDVLERSRGKRFVKYFLRFMSTIARFQREAAEREAANGVKVEGTTDECRNRGDSAPDSSIGGVAGEARNIGGISESSDPCVSSESPLNEGSAEGFGTGIGTV